jgi:hypothetical protein
MYYTLGKLPNALSVRARGKHVYHVLSTTPFRTELWGLAVIIWCAVSGSTTLFFPHTQQVISLSAPWQARIFKFPILVSLSASTPLPLTRETLPLSLLHRR